MYNELVVKLSKRFSKEFLEISSHYNFDKGEEFEIALCKALRTILPEKYGICRGFIVTKSDECAGDDIIIYDKNNFPTLRFLEKDTFEKKEDIPIEAVYAYIEAKHTLYLQGKGGQSLFKAVEQIKAIKALTRKPVRRGTIKIDRDYCQLFEPNDMQWPKIANPLYCAIISRYVKRNSQDDVTELQNFFEDSIDVLAYNDMNPDMLIMGENYLALPAIRENGKCILNSPFMIYNVSQLTFLPKTEYAFGTGILSLLFAIDNIRLEGINWIEIIGNSLGINKME